MKLNLRYVFCVGWQLLFFQLHAQVQFAIAVDVKEIGKKDELQVDYVISGTDRISGFKPPYFDKWKVVSGPDYSSVSYNVNGKKDQTNKYSYVLVPVATGKIRLPATTVEINNKKISCNEVVITVKKQDHVDGVPPPGSNLQFQGGVTMADELTQDEFAEEYVLKPGEDPNKKIRKNLFVKAIPSKSKVYVGEPVLVTYRLYTRLKSHSRVLKQPSFTGCSVHEMTTSDMMPEKAKVDGKLYNSYLFRKVQLFPLQAGIIGATPASVENTVTFLSSGSDLRSLYYDMPTGNEQTIVLSTEPFSIEVMPLPKEAGSLAIGDFKISGKLKKDTSAANEANALVVTIEGSGNFKTVTEPEIQWPGNVYHFDATETDEIDKLSFPLAGKRVFEIPFEANTTDKVDIAPISFSFFDPVKGAVRTVQTGALHLTVTPAVKGGIQKTITAAKGAGFGIQPLFYIILLAFIAGAVLIWRKSGKKLQPAVDITVNPVTETPAPRQPDIMEKYNSLLLVQGDAEFYNKAGAFARQMIQSGKGDHDLLRQVLQDCNTMLYTPLPTTSKKEVLDKLQRAIT